MKQTALRPPFMLIFAAAFAIGGALASTALAETVKPRVLTLTDRTEAVLPGDQAGDKLGIAINRGSGFPQPVIVQQAPATVEEDAPLPVRPTVRRRSAY